MTGQLKEGNERPVHITLSHDDTMRLKAALSYYVEWKGGDYGKFDRVYMVLDAAIGAAGYYNEEQPGLHSWSDERRVNYMEGWLERLRRELAKRGCVMVDKAPCDANFEDCPTETARRPEDFRRVHWCAPCEARKRLEENEQIAS